MEASYRGSRCPFTHICEVSMLFGLSVSNACRAALLAALLPLILIGSSAGAHAQSGTGAVAGVVLDPDAKAVAGAGIVVRNETTNDIRTTTTDASGRYTVSGLLA